MKKLFMLFTIFGQLSCSGGRQPAPSDAGLSSGENNSLDDSGDLDAMNGGNSSSQCNAERCDRVQLKLKVKDSTGNDITSNSLTVTSSGERFEFQADTDDASRDVVVIIAAPPGVSVQGNGQKIATMVVSQTSTSSTQFLAIVRDMTMCSFLNDAGQAFASCDDFSNINEQADQRFEFTLSSSSYNPTNPTYPTDPQNQGGGLIDILKPLLGQ